MGTPFFVLSGGLAAWGKGLPSASRLRAGHVPPAPPACGPTPCPPCAAAVPPPAPSSPCGSGRGNVAAKAAPVARPGQVGRQPLRGGTPPQCKAKPLRGGPKARPCIAPPPHRLRRRCSGAARPPLVGALGPSAPPARSAALRPALPARPRLRRRPCRSALPTHSPPGVAARGPSLGVPPPSRAGAPAAGCCCSPCPCGGGRNLDRRAHWRRKRRLPAHSRAAGRGERRLRAGVPAVAPAGKAKASPAQGGKPPTGGGLACQCPGQRWANVAGVPPSGGSPALFSFWGLGGACRVVCCCLSCVWLRSCLVAGLSSWWCLWLGAVPACPVALALCTGGGFCLSAGGGVPWAFLACWCFCRSAGCGSVRVTAPLWVLSLAGGGPRSGCCLLPLIWAVPALIGGKSDRQREEKPPSGNQQNQRGAFASRSKTTINGRPKRQRRRCSAQAYESKV